MKKFYNVHTIWLLMIVLTLSTYLMGMQGWSGIAVVLFLLLTAVIKGGLIIRDFMELRDVSFLWRAIMYGWLWTVCISIAVTYIISL
mgnify:FL=1